MPLPKDEQFKLGHHLDSGFSWLMVLRKRKRKKAALVELYRR